MSSIRLNMFHTCEFLFQNMWYIYDLKQNIFYMIMFDCLGYCTIIEHDMLRISHGALRITKSLKMFGLYILDDYIVIGHACIASQYSYIKIKLWHLRVGHDSERSLVELVEQSLLGKNKLEKLEFTDNCIRGKSYKVKFRSDKHHPSNPFKYAHLYLWGPSKVTTRGEALIFLFIFTMTDDYSRRVQIHIL